jgi:hypothetical protein
MFNIKIKIFKSIFCYLMPYELIDEYNYYLLIIIFFIQI